MDINVVFILLACVVVALGIYNLIVRPFIMPLSERIPTGKSYRATLRGRRHGIR